MRFEEIDLDQIDQNPFQTRVKYDEDKLIGIMGTATDELGIRYTPMIRPHPKKTGRYQIASGWGRYNAMKALGWKKHVFRIEELTDGQMKKEVLVENVNRSDLTEAELYNAMEQYREELGLKPEKIGFYSTLSKETGIPDSTIHNNYDVTRMRTILCDVEGFDEKLPSQTVILRTQGLEDEERVKLVVKAQERGWSGATVHSVKTSIKDMVPEVRAMVLDEKTKLTHKTISAIAELEDPEMQKHAIQFITAVGLGEDSALKYILRVKAGDRREETIIIDEVEEIFAEFNETRRNVLSWGVNHYMILGKNKWAESRTIFDTIEKQMQFLKRDGFLNNIAELEPPKEGKVKVVKRSEQLKDLL